MSRHSRYTAQLSRPTQLTRGNIDKEPMKVFGLNVSGFNIKEKQLFLHWLFREHSQREGLKKKTTIVMTKVRKTPIGISSSDKYMAQCGEPVDDY